MSKKQISSRKSLKLIIASIGGPLCLVYSSLTFAGTRFQILHTSDTHSFYDHSHLSFKMGGFARLKTMINKFKIDAAQNGMKTLVLDSGDFAEGNIFYMSKYAQRSFEMMDKVGYDAVVLGNHDYLMGPERLDQILNDTNFKYTLLAANVKSPAKYPSIREKVKPYTIFDIDGKKVAVMGSTTPDRIFTFRLGDVKVKDAKKEIYKLEDRLHQQGIDGIIHLNHLGLSVDKKMAKKLKHTDMILGGHSHDLLMQPVWVKNEDNRKIPIMHTGIHVSYVSKLIVEFDDATGEMMLVDRQVIPVQDVEEDKEISEVIHEANMDLYKIYGEDWLNTTVGQSYVPRWTKKGEEEFGYFITDAMRDAAKTDVAFHAPSMNGENYPPTGPITRRDLINGFPRFFEVDQVMSYKIHTMKIHGSLIETAFKAIMDLNLPVAFTGVEFKTKKIFGKRFVYNLKINGKRISMNKLYTFAVNEGITRGALGVSPLLKAIFKNMKDTGKYVIPAVEDKLARDYAFALNKNDIPKRNIASHVDEASTPSSRTFFQPEDE